VHLRPSKGVHLVFAPGTVRTTAAVVAPSAARDGRYIFIVPWEDRVYAGTTDTPYQGDLDTPAVGDTDRDYILAAVAGLFPGVSDRDVVASWAGLRPLLSQDDAGDTTSSDLSRKHAVFTGPFGLYTITGGKLTTYRAMAEDLVDRVAAELCRQGRGDAGPCRTREIPLGLHGPAAAAVRLARDEVRRLGLPPRTAVRLVQRYGDDWRQAARLIGEDLILGEPVADGLPVLGVEVALARSREMALTDEDVYVRRTRLTTLGLTSSAGSRPG
jgi:glycerol-3-phosphate dehydrogenase